MNKKILIALFAVTAVIGFISPSCNFNREGSKKVEVGVILPLTGDAAVYGKAIRDGIELAMQQKDPNGAKNIDLTYEDDQGLPRQAISAVRRMIDTKHTPIIIGGAMSSTAEPIIPIVDKAKVVLLSPTATKPGLPEMSSFFFRLWPSDNYDGKVMAKAIYNKLKFRRVAILYVNVAYGVGISQVFTREFEKLGGKIISSDGYQQGATDFRTLLTRISLEKPDAIYLPGYAEEIGNIFRQARELDIKAQFIGVNSLYDPKLIEMAGAAAEGAVFTYPTFDVASTDSSIKAFVVAFRARYGHNPDVFAAQGYDACKIVVRAVELSDKFDGSSLRDSMHRIGRYSGAGGTFEFDDQGDVEKPLRLLTVRNGAFVPFESNHNQ